MPASLHSDRVVTQSRAIVRVVVFAAAGADDVQCGRIQCRQGFIKFGNTDEDHSNERGTRVPLLLPPQLHQVCREKGRGCSENVVRTAQGSNGHHAAAHRAVQLNVETGGQEHAPN